MVLVAGAVARKNVGVADGQGADGADDTVFIELPSFADQIKIEHLEKKNVGAAGAGFTWRSRRCILTRETFALADLTRDCVLDFIPLVITVTLLWFLATPAFGTDVTHRARMK